MATGWPRLSRRKPRIVSKPLVRLFQFDPFATHGYLTELCSERSVFVRDKRWKLYDDGRFFDLRADKRERQPLKKLDPEATLARRRLEAVFEEVRSRH